MSSIVSWYLLVIDSGLREEGSVFKLPDALVLVTTNWRTPSRAVLDQV